jgi:hypothetical protein
MMRQQRRIIKAASGQKDGSGAIQLLVARRISQPTSGFAVVL